MRVGRSALIAAMRACGAASAVAGQQARPRPRNAVVAGTVTDSVTGAPIAGATVTFQRADRTVFTDERGNFSVRLPEGAEAMTIEQLGYHSAQEPLAVDSGMAPRALRLAPDPVALKGIAVINRRLRSSSLAIAMSVRTFDDKDLARAPAWSVGNYLNSRGAFTPMRCPLGAWSSMCIWSRGQVIEPSVWLDDYRLIGGLEELMTMPLHDVYRVDVYQHGLFIHVVTKWWMELAVSHGWTFSPLF